MYYSSVCYSSTNLLVLGDSLSAGYGLPKNESWVDLLAVKLRDNNYDVVVSNASVTGATSADGLNALPRLLNADQPNILILALGSNDGLRGNPIAQLYNNLAAIIRSAQEHDIKVLLIGFMLPPNFGTAYASQFAAVFPNLSKEYDIPLVPFLLSGFEQDPAYFQQDRLHPTAEAQVMMLQNVWPRLVDMLPAPVN